MVDKMRSKFAIPVVICLSVLSLILQLTGYVTPGWAIIESSDTLFTYKAGLWYIIKCSTSACSTNSIMSEHVRYEANSIKYIVHHSIVGLQTETTVALVLTILASVTVLFFRKFPQHHVSLIFVIVILMVCHLLSGAAALIACGTRAKESTELDKAYDLHIPYSIILTGIGSVMNLIAVLFLILHIVHVVRTLKSQSDKTPFYLKSQMHQPLTKEDPKKKKNERTKKEKAADKDPATITEPNIFENTIAANGVERDDLPRKQRSEKPRPRHTKHATSKQRNYQFDTDETYEYTHNDLPRKPRLGDDNPATSPQSNYQDNIDATNDYTQDNVPRKPRSKTPRLGHANPTTSPRKHYQDNIDEYTQNVPSEYIQNGLPRKSRSKASKLDHAYPATSPQTHYQDNIDAMNAYTQNVPMEYTQNDPTEYTQNDLPRKPRPGKTRPGRDSAVPTSHTHQQDYTDATNDYSQDDPPRKSRSKKPRIGENNPVMAPDNYNDNSSATDRNAQYNSEHLQMKQRPPSYYEKLELESQYHAYHGPAAFNPAESTV